MSLKKNIIQLLSFAFLLWFAFQSFEVQRPVIKQESDLRIMDFNYSKAIEKLKKFTKEPHYTGSEESAVVREYLVEELKKLGLKVELQEGIAWSKANRRATRPTNIIAKLPATNPTDSTKSLMLMTHYDSAMHSSPGASDAGSGVVTILESLRAFLASDPNFINNILVVFTDSEEIGLLGAQLFVDNYKDLDQVAMVLNFEARGSGGRSYMFMETPDSNASLLALFKEADVHRPVANSLMYSIYKKMPNDTDLTVIKEQGDIPGFNFAFIGDHFDYHTAQDTAERLDTETLIQQGNYLLASLKYFSSVPLTSLAADQDYIYSNFPGLGLISYPYSWNIPLLILAYIIYLLLVFLGLGHGKLSVGGIMQGLMPLFLSILISVLVSMIGWKMLLNIYPHYQDMLHGFTYNGYWYIGAFMALSTFVFFFVYNRFANRLSRENMMVGPLFLWIFLNLGLVIGLPGGSFLILPVFFGLIAFGYVLFAKRDYPFLQVLFLAPVLFLVLPFARMFPVGLGLKALPVAALFLVLILSLGAGYFKVLTFRKYLAPISLFTAVALLLVAHKHSDYNTVQRKPNSMNYVYDHSLEKAFWETYDLKLDSYTSTVFNDNRVVGPYRGEIKNGKYQSGIRFHQDAPIVRIPKPDVHYLQDSTEVYHLRIKNNREVNRMELYTDRPELLRDLVINGREVDYQYKNSSSKRVLIYFKGNLQDSLDLAFKAPEKLSFELIESSYDLQNNPYIQVAKRDSVMIPTPFVLNDAIIQRLEIE